MKAVIIVIGSEILSGETVDTNSQFIGVELGKIGIQVAKKITIPDNQINISEAIDEGFEHASIIITTGGLGPTSDDITKRTLAEYFNCDMVFNENVYNNIVELLKHRYKTVSEAHKSQAYIPALAKPLENRMGTASGLLFEENNKILISLPGVPFEMKYLIENHVIPFLKIKNAGNFLISRNIKTIGIPESLIADKIKEVEDNLPSEISLAYLPSIGQVKLRLTGLSSDKEKLVRLMKSVERELVIKVNDYVYGYDDETIEIAIGRLLISQNASLGIAESCTGGYISHLLTSVPGSSEYYKGGVIVYSNHMKIQLLGIDELIIKEYGAVSCECAEAMSKAVIEKLGVDYAIATTGIAGPGGGTDLKPVGLVWISVSTRKKTISKRIIFDRGRIQNIQLSALTALDLLRKVILNLEK
jgi:nicotinamide-nucleotide amidase